MTINKSSTDLAGSRARNAPAGHFQRIQPSKDNDRILSEVLAVKVKVARDQRYPSASSLLDSIGNTGVIFK